MPPLKPKKGVTSTRSDFGGRRQEYDNSIAMEPNQNAQTMNSEGERKALQGGTVSSSGLPKAVNKSVMDGREISPMKDAQSTGAKSMM